MTIGLSVIVAILILIFGIEYLKGINLFRPSHFYMAYFDNVTGLTVSSPVYINGYKVGQVRELNFDYTEPGAKTEVLLALNKHLEIPEDSYAFIGSSIMGEGHIAIVLGNSSTLLSSGAEIPTSQGSGLLSDLSDTLMPKITETLSNVDSLLTNLNLLIKDPAISQSILRLDGITRNIELASGGLDNLLSKDVPSIMKNANGVVTNVDDIVLKIDTISSNLAMLSEELTRLPLSQTMTGINRTVDNLENFTGDLKNQNSTLGMLMNDPELYNRLNNVAASVDSLINDIKKNPKRYINIKLL